MRRSRYELHLPYTIVLRLGWGGEKGMVYFFASQPIDESHCSGYVVMARNYDRDQPPEVLQDFEDTIFNQDKRVVESQRPEQVPFDLADELHLKFDAVAVAYRRAMRAEGLATSRVTDPQPGVKSMIQFVSQVSPSSSENACSQRGVGVVTPDQMKRTRIGRPSKTSRPSKTPVSSENVPKTGGSSSPGRRLSAQ